MAKHIINYIYFYLKPKEKQQTSREFYPKPNMEFKIVYNNKKSLQCNFPPYTYRYQVYSYIDEVFTIQMVLMLYLYDYVAVIQFMFRCGIYDLNMLCLEITHMYNVHCTYIHIFLCEKNIKIGQLKQQKSNNQIPYTYTYTIYIHLKRKKISANGIESIK